MKKTSTLLCLSLLMLGSLTSTVANAKADLKRFKYGNNRPGISTMRENARTSFTYQMGKAGLKVGPLMAPRRVGSEPVSDTSAPLWGQIEGPNGEQWYYTQSIAVDGYSYKSSDITVFDDKHNQMGKVHVDIPEGLDVNDIEPYGFITKKFFDNNEKTQELTVSIHVPGNKDNDYEGAYATYIYNLDGALVKKIDGWCMMVDASHDWTTYQRLLLETEKKVGDKTYNTIDIYAPGGYSSDDLVKEHSFTIDFDLINYCDGPYLNMYTIDNEPYYVFSHYDKPYVAEYGGEGGFEIVPTENNSYVLETFDKSFNRVDSFAAPIEKPENALYRFASFGVMSDRDMSKDYYTNDGKPAYVVTFQDYITSSDSYTYNFHVFNSKGEYVKTICDNSTEAYFKLTDVKGQSEQMAFMQEIGETQQIQMVDIPSCEKKTLIPALLGNELISTTVDRCAVGDSYQYVISMGQAITDAQDNVIARIGWYKTDLTLDHFTSFNLGPNGQLFNPLLNSTTLNPYVFDTDDDMEYIYIAKVKKTTDNTIEDVLFVGNEDGTTMKEFRGDDTKGALRTAVMLTEDTTTPELMLVFNNYNTGLYDMQFYSLPFEKFAKGGTGTKSDPYLISTAGDMLQITAAPDASYKLVNDIDMNTYNQYWTPVSEFGGTLDGDGHALSNLSINSSEYYAGLFGSLTEGSKVKNLMVIYPSITVNEGNSSVGVIAGTALTDTITNVHIYGAQIADATNGVDTKFGGLVGESSLYGEISSSSFAGTINLPGAEYVGGIAGNTRTTTNIFGCSASGQFTAGNSLGGIAGSTETAAEVHDCYANVVLKAENTVGGIVGNNEKRALINKCYALGKIEATKAGWGGLAAGGIAGSLLSDWSSSKTAVISNCVSSADIVVPEPETGEEADATVHRIVGETIANEDYEPGEEPKKDAGLTNNYATGTVTVGGKTVASDDNTSVEGASKDAADYGKEFFTTLGYAYGNTIEAPWKGDNGMPVLYFENIATALTLSETSLTMKEGETKFIAASVYGTDASEINVVSSDPSVAEVSIIGEENGTVTIQVDCKKIGNAVITVTAGNLSATCTVSPVVTGIDAAVAENGKMTISQTANSLSVNGASSLRLYTTGGQLAAKANGSSVITGGMTKGIYVAVATDANGHTVTSKVIIK